jgi:hypothetical protein
MESQKANKVGNKKHVHPPVWKTFDLGMIEGSQNVSNFENGISYNIFLRLLLGHGTTSAAFAVSAIVTVVSTTPFVGSSTSSHPHDSNEDPTFASEFKVQRKGGRPMGSATLIDSNVHSYMKKWAR